VLQCVAVCCRYDMVSMSGPPICMLQCVSAYCSVLQCVADMICRLCLVHRSLCCSVLQCFADMIWFQCLVYWSVCCSVLQCVAVCCGYGLASMSVSLICALQCVAVCYSVLRCFLDMA